MAAPADGTHGIQMARAHGARVAVTAGAQNKLDLCAELGAEITIGYQDEDFVERVRSEVGADVILDIMGAAYLDRNVDALAAGEQVGEGVDVAVEVGRAHDVEDHVGARPVGLSTCIRSTKSSAWYPMVISAPSFVHRSVCSAARRAVTGAEGARHLDAVRSDAAGAAMEKQEMSGRQMRGHHQVRPHRASHFLVARRHDAAAPPGDRHDLARGHGDEAPRNLRLPAKHRLVARRTS